MAKEILAVFVFISIVVSIACQEYVRGSLVRRLQGRSGIVTNFNCETSPNSKECSICQAKFGQACSDCQTTLLCFGKPVIAQACAMLDPSKPYCRDSDGECVAEDPIAGASAALASIAARAAPLVPPSAPSAPPLPPTPSASAEEVAPAAPSTSCVLTSTTVFKCTGEGQFPDPDDCTKYYYCTEAGIGKESEYHCPHGYVYSSKTGLCKQRKTNADCKTISCKNRLNQYQIFSADKSILALCVQSGETNETILFRCPDSTNMEYDEHSLKCKFICKTEGRFSIEGEPNKYLECYRNGKVLALRTQACPTSFTFNKDLKICKHTN